MAIMMSPDGTRFVTVGLTGEVKLWDMEKPDPLRTWVMPTPVRNILFTPNGKNVITANGDTTLYLLELP
jgi:WD40 repeat protein